MTSSKEIKKEILYRSIHRGCKETDHLIGGFIKSKIDSIADDQLVIIRGFILEDDLLIYDWIMSRADCPVEYKELVALIREFHGIDL